MINEAPFIIYQSSAGSGKTFTIAKEYLKLALASPFYFKKILAVTFTNKAADEMKERVLSFLTQLSNGEKMPFSAELAESLHCTESELEGKAEEVIRNILHDYSGFAITTIDTFFNQVIRTFTREIGLQGGFEIEMDLDDVLTEIVDKMLAGLGEDEALKRWLVDFALERLRDGKSYEFREEIKYLARQLFQEEYKSLESNHRGLEVSRDFLSKLGNSLKQSKSSFEGKLQDIGVRALQEIKRAGLVVEDFSNGKSGVAGQFAKWEQEDFAPPGKRALDAAENAEKWSSKKSPLKEKIVNFANERLIPLLSEGLSFYQTNLTHYHTAIEVGKYLYTFGLLNDLAGRIREYREEREVILISDLPQFLRQIVDDSDTPYIYEKIGNRYQHFLIDEFQDTSGFQWGNFKPLVSNSMASGHLNMIVGDVKQSIYRWRGGNADLLLNQAGDDVGKNQVTEKYLSVNYRSHRQVVDFNNDLFQVTPHLLRDALALELEGFSENASVQDRLQFLVASYESVEQQKPEQIPADGYVQLEFSAKPGRGESLNWDDLAIQWTIRQIERLQQHNFSLNDMTILVRDSVQENKLVLAINQYKNSPDANPSCRYDIISAQAMYLTNASVVNFMISVFKYLNNPKEEIALREIIHEYQRNILGNEHDLHELFSRDMSTYLPKDFVQYAHILGRFSLYELTEIVIRVFNLQQKQGELAYLQAFQDAVLDYTKNEKGDINSFLIWWQKKGRKRTVQFSDNLEAIRVLTIHKSKGLQFKNVLMPFCNWPMDHPAIFNNILWASGLSDEMFKETSALPLRYSAALKDTGFSTLYFDEKIKAHHDNLNLLYVALTRAEQNLLIHAPLPSKSRVKGTISLISDLLWDHVSNLSQFDEEKGIAEWGELVDATGEGKTSSNKEVHLEKYQSNKWRDKLLVRKQAGEYFDFGETEKELKVNFGRLTHQILSEVKYKEELIPAIQSAYMALKITSEDAEKLEMMIGELFKNPLIDTWYSRAYEVRNEVVVLPKDGRIKRLDRVLIKDHEAIVIDFKTGASNAKDQLQVLEYVQLLEEMGYGSVKGYLVYINRSQVVEVA